jgi:hypothetical protein
MKPEPCPTSEGLVLPGGWILWRKDIAGTWWYQGRELGSRLSTPWSSDLKHVQEQAFTLVRKRGPFYPVPDDSTMETCRSCGAKIIWAKTLQGKAIPLSVASIEWRGKERYANSHFSDCPDAKDWRQQPRPEPVQASADPQPSVVQESFL